MTAESPAAGPADLSRAGRVRAWAERLWPQADVLLFCVWCAVVTGYVGGVFFGSMLLQTGGAWSAPLDDVFIHFDYARATARGYPLSWSEGNGISSGNTSITYPFLLAIGYRLGFTELWLGAFAGGLAVASTIAFLITSARAFHPLGRVAKYLLPPTVLSMGALGWTLFSGMENAVHLALFGLAFLLCLRTDARRAAGDPFRASAIGTGVVGALLVLTRPESVACVAAMAIFLAVRARGLGVRRALGLLFAASLPGVVALGALATLLRLTTGEWSQAGAIAKLALNHPYLSRAEKWDDWLGHVRYVLGRTTLHHFAEHKPWGLLVPIAAVVPLLSARVRPVAIMLWAMIIGWVALVSLNGQVRWQNERYVMPAVAWLLLLAALGLGVLLRGPASRRPIASIGFGARFLAAGALIVLYAGEQLPRFRDQVWFFGRASRNIRDQHLTTGKVLHEIQPRRILVGDAGAILYAADRPGLDLIGLGGYHDVPFARAGRHGLGASIELIERLSADERPDVMAIYPHWWGELPLIFGTYVTEIPVVGNVICGGPSKVLYRTRWGALDREGAPRSLASGERVVSALDVADLVSEREAGYRLPGPGRGYVVFRVLPDPGDPARDLFDAGRIVPHGQVESGRLAMPAGPGRVIVRTVTTSPQRAEVRVGGQPFGELVVPEASGGWVEVSADLPGGLPSPATLEIVPETGDWATYHIWIVEKPR